MLVVGIDPGIATTGYGIVRPSSSGRLEAVAFGVLRTDPAIALPDRLAVLYQGMTGLLALHHPDEAAVERLYFQRNVTTAMVVGEARGVLLLALAQAGIPVGEYTPGEIKQAITAYGSARKQQMQEMIRLLFGLAESPRPDDAADALAVAVCHLQRTGLEERVGGSA
jgi:crossover junction endodeoxyribonuclease RuvC